MIIATGVSYRGLEVPELDLPASAGVFYGAATTEAQTLAGKRAFVVGGGGNSAGQPAVHLSRYAQQVTILIRSNALAASMSRYLIREIATTPNIDVRYHTEVAGGGDGRLEQLRLRRRDTGESQAEPADGLLVLIGAQPFTGWLPERPVGPIWSRPEIPSPASRIRRPSMRPANT